MLNIQSQDYYYPQSVEARIIDQQGGRIFSPYSGRTFANAGETDIEHLVRLSTTPRGGKANMMEMKVSPPPSPFPGTQKTCGTHGGKNVLASFPQILGHHRWGQNRCVSDTVRWPTEVVSSAGQAFTLAKGFALTLKRSCLKCSTTLSGPCETAHPGQPAVRIPSVYPGR